MIYECLFRRNDVAPLVSILRLRFKQDVIFSSSTFDIFFHTLHRSISYIIVYWFNVFIFRLDIPGGLGMDSQQQFCLKWNSFGSNLATAFSNLFKSESLADVTLFCEGERTIFDVCAKSKHYLTRIFFLPNSTHQLVVNGRLDLT